MCPGARGRSCVDVRVPPSPVTVEPHDSDRTLQWAVARGSGCSEVDNLRVPFDDLEKVVVV
eukprot:scaffold29286_cov63-Phaeocystis_antarctica.AAC.3